MLLTVPLLQGCLNFCVTHPRRVPALQARWGRVYISPVGHLNTKKVRVKQIRKSGGEGNMVRILRALLGVCLLTSTGSAQQKKRVAVLNFDYVTVMTSVQAIFGSNHDVGKGITDLLVQKLVEDGKYSVIKRSALDKVLAEPASASAFSMYRRASVAF